MCYRPLRLLCPLSRRARSPPAHHLVTPFHNTPSRRSLHPSTPPAKPRAQTEAAAKTACLLNARAQAKDADKASQLKALKAEKPQPYGGKSAWRASYVTITLDEYADFAARAAKCASTLGVAGRRRLQQDAPGAAPPAPAVNSTDGAPPPADGAMLPAGPVAGFWAAAAARYSEAAAAANATSDEPPRSSAARDAFARTIEALRSRAAGARPAAAARAAAAAAGATATAAPAAVVPSGCQGLVDWVVAKGDATVRALAPMARQQVAALRDGAATRLATAAGAAATAAGELVGAERWRDYLDACAAAEQRAYDSKECSFACVMETQGAADVIVAAGAATKKLQDQLQTLQDLASGLAGIKAGLKSELCRAADWKGALYGELEEMIRSGTLNAKVGGAGIGG
jgi:hypothetical protein